MRDYKSFSTAAKPRFRPVGEKLGFSQVSGIFYIKQRDGWFEGFNLQASGSGAGFYINYGVAVPQLWAPFQESHDPNEFGLYLSKRLYNKTGAQGFQHGTKREIEESADVALACLTEQAVPWFAQFRSLTDIFDEHYTGKEPKTVDIGRFDFTSVLRLASYGLFLYQIGRLDEALVWLRECERMYSAPKWWNRPGGLQFVKGKYARKYELEDSETKQLGVVRSVIEAIEGAA